MPIKKQTIYEYLPDTRNPNALCFTCKFSYKPPDEVIIFLGKSYRNDGTDTQIHWSGCSHNKIATDYTMAKNECEYFELQENESEE